jgi:hypothetical protein
MRRAMRSRSWPPGESSEPASGFQDPLDTQPNFIGGYEIAVLRGSKPELYRFGKTRLIIEETINRLPDEVVRLPSIPDSELREAGFLIWV